MKNLIYYYPFGENAPAYIARQIFHHILKFRNEIPLEIKVISSKSDEEKMWKMFKDVEIISINSQNFKLKNNIIHIPTSLFIAPNNRVLMFLKSIINNNYLILNYHGDIRIETKYEFCNKNYLKFLQYIPSYILIPSVLGHAQKIIVNSRNMKELLEYNYGLKHKAHIIPNAIDNFWFEKNVSHLSLDGDPNIFYHGRLSSEKGVDLLIRAIHQIKRKRPNVKFYVFGNGPQLNWLKRMANKLEMVGNIFFLGYLQKEILKSYLISSDFCVYPSRYEPFSLAILEAMSSSNSPVYFSEKAGIKNFIDDCNYSLISFPPNTNNIVSILEKAITNQYDKTKILDEQKQFSKYFKWDNISKYYIDIYKNVA